MSKAWMGAWLYLGVLLALPVASQALPPIRHVTSPARLDCVDRALPAEILDGPFVSTKPHLPVVRVRSGAVVLRLAVAVDDETLDRGLMCVTRLRARHGMLFVFADSGSHPFWMKNTLIPLDMIWVSRAGVVTTVWRNVPASVVGAPEDSLARRQGWGRFVIELPAGEAVTDGLVPGLRVRFRLAH